MNEEIAIPHAGPSGAGSFNVIHLNTTCYTMRDVPLGDIPAQMTVPSHSCPYCTTHPIKAEHLAAKILDMITGTTAEMERVSEQLALDMQSDLVDEIEQVCKQHVEKVQ